MAKLLNQRLAVQTGLGFAIRICPEGFFVSWRPFFIRYIYSAEQYKQIQREFLDVYVFYYGQLLNLSDEYADTVNGLARGMAENFEGKNPYLVRFYSSFQPRKSKISLEEMVPYHYTPCKLCLWDGEVSRYTVFTLFVRMSVHPSVCPSVTFWSLRRYLINTAYWSFLFRSKLFVFMLSILYWHQPQLAIYINL